MTEIENAIEILKKVNSRLSNQITMAELKNRCNSIPSLMNKYHANALAITALQEKAERDKGCGITEITSETQHNEIYTDCICNNCKGIVSVYDKYCKNCGRKLV